MTGIWISIRTRRKFSFARISRASWPLVAIPMLSPTFCSSAMAMVRLIAMSSTSSTRSLDQCGKFARFFVLTASVAGLTRAIAKMLLKRKQVPTPGVLSSEMLPPISSTSCRQMARPRPVPPKRRVMLLSACAKGANRLLWCSGGMPMPVSRMEKSSRIRPSGRCSPRWASTSISPVGVNLMALLTRLISTWPRRSGSPCKAGGRAGSWVKRSTTPWVRALVPNRPRTELKIVSSSKGVLSSIKPPASILE